AYQELLSQYPGSAQARNSLVSLGDIQLDHMGRPGRALKSFDSYLARTRKGTLAQEAAFGRARALRALGRTAEEIRALQTFLAAFPAAIQAPRSRQRLEENK
ncbi:MAG: tetratricopeptide repeat protein, partial [Deltaproteobacteria bacterium]|nr:tetratricopeptide repeat protein [Deltaproteobacteria bacterium]